MQLTWDNTINLSAAANNPDPKLVSQLLLGNEPTNEIYQYYTFDGFVGDKVANIDLSNYTTLSWETAKQLLTSQRVRNIGIKTFPQIGAYGFYTPLYETESKLIVPLHSHSEKSVAPTLAVTQGDSTLTFVVTPPDNIFYMCYRIIMRTGYRAVEYITYDTTLIVDKPATGDYTAYCIGYIEDGGVASNDSPSVDVSVVNNVAPTVAHMSFNQEGHLVLTLADGTVIVSSNAAPGVSP